MKRKLGSDSIIRRATADDFRQEIFEIGVPRKWRRVQMIPARFRVRRNNLYVASQLFHSLVRMMGGWASREERYLRGVEIRIRTRLGKGFHVVRHGVHITITRLN